MQNLNKTLTQVAQDLCSIAPVLFQSYFPHNSGFFWDFLMII